MESLPRPDFERIGFMVDSRFLPADVLRELRGLLPKAMSAAAADDFLQRVAEAAHIAFETRQQTSTKKTVAELEMLANRARALLQAVRRLNPDSISTFGAHWDYLALASVGLASTAPPVTLSELSCGLARAPEGRFLGAAWDIVADVETAARYAVGQCEPSRAAKPTDLNARSLVYQVAGAFRVTTGRVPPYSKGTWFPAFMAALGEAEPLKLKCGRALVESVIRAHFGAVPPD